MNPGGSGQTQLTDCSSQGLYAICGGKPSWSPDGAKIAASFSIDQTNGYSDVYVMNSDGSGLTRLTYSGQSQMWSDYPVWSSDGRRIIFLFGGTTTSGASGSAGIYSMNADGSNQLLLGSNAAWPGYPIDCSRCGGFNQ